jgi:signal transduction histidine kinase/sensor domain CHASE-containing protein
MSLEKKKYKNEVEEQFYKNASSIVTILSQRLESSLNNIETLAVYYNASEKVEQHEFKMFTQHIMEQSPEIQAIQWVPYIIHKNRKSYEDSARSIGFTDFQITSYNNNEQMEKSPEKQDYFPVYFIEPFEANKSSLGFDLSSSAPILKTLNLSRDTGTLQVSEKISLISTNKSQHGFLVCYPIYQKKVAINTKALRRRHHLGFVSGIFQIENILKILFTYIEIKDIEIHIYDTSAPKEKQFLGLCPLCIPHAHSKNLNISSDELRQNAPYYFQTSIKLSERTWQIICTPSKPLTAKWLYTPSQWILLIIGISFTLCSVLLTSLIMNKLSQRKKYLLQQERSRRKLEEANKSLKINQIQMVQAEKMISIGQLSAGIAHEINTPIQYIGDNSKFLKEAFDDIILLHGRQMQLLNAIENGNGNDLSIITQDIKRIENEVDADYIFNEIPEAIAHTMEGVDRVSNIVRAMKEFASPGKQEKTFIDLNEAVKTTITICKNEWKYVADIETDLDQQLPLVRCLPGDINQVILNIITNGAHAISQKIDKLDNKKGVIRIQTCQFENWVDIKIEDNGIGIPEENRTRLYDPFFTTKEVGKGSGQGLSLSYAIIVEKHKGKIFYKTELGKGTIFTIRLPLEVRGRKEIREHG